MTAARRREALAPSAPKTRSANPWHALWAMLVGFFMILVDSTIVAVANPSIMAALGADYDSVIWVTSAYLLAYAVPLLVAGRLGDRFGPKNLYLIGLAVFTVASLACGLADSVGLLIAARVVQGLGAALLTPQTLSTITRIFPAERRGVAMSLWGATAGVAMLVGPLAGGVLVDHLGWQWIFFVNVPIGVVGLALAWFMVPVLPTQGRSFDLLGVALSGVGMFLIVFALQEGQSHDWALWIWGMVAAGLGFMAGFVYWQSINPGEPLIPLSLFGDRNFSLSNVGVAVIGFVVTAMVLPAMFYAQAVCGLTPTQSALLTAPMAVASGGLAPVVGRIVDRAHPRPIIGFGFAVVAVALTWLSFETTPTTPIWRLILPFTVMGVGMAFIWAPLAATATRNLPPAMAGAGSGVYNATRQVGSVIGSAGMAAFMTSRISAELPGGDQQGASQVVELPGFLHPPFAAAMSQSLLLPAFVALFGVVAALFLVGGGVRTSLQRAVSSARVGRSPDDRPTDVLEPVVSDPLVAYRRPVTGAPDDHDVDVEDDDVDYDDDEFYEEDDRYDDEDYFDDEDDYVEHAVVNETPRPARSVRPPSPAPQSPPEFPADDRVTQPIPTVPTAVEPRRPDPPQSTERRSGEWMVPDPVDDWDRFLDDLKTDLRAMSDEPIGHAHNGFHVDHDHDRTPISEPDPLFPHGYDAGLSTTNGHVNGLGSGDRHSSDFLNGLGMPTSNGFFADLTDQYVPPQQRSRHYRLGGDSDPEPDDVDAASTGSRHGTGHHRGEVLPQNDTGSWRFVDGAWQYESSAGRHSQSTDPDDSGRGRHSHPHD